MKIAIQGHPTRGKEVIQILKSLGGKNTNHLHGNNCDGYYCILGDNHITSIFSILGHKVYTLEEFEKEFPFKIGDKVTIIGLSNFSSIITQMRWDCDEILYSFKGLNNTWFSAKSLKKFKMKEERNITLTLDKAKEWYKKGGELKEVALQAFTEEELNPLPRSWEGYCKYNSTLTTSFSSCAKYDAFVKLEHLRDCWLGEWTPKWDTSEKWCIRLYRNQLHVGLCTDISRFLTFPTREMAEAFLECFRNLIELAKYLI